MEQHPKQTNGEGTGDIQVKFHYIKSAQFRTIHADGAIGSVTPAGLIHMAIYNERAPIPRETTHLVTADGRLSDVIHDKTVSRSGIVREMDVDVIMSVPAAKEMAKWLGDQINKLEQLQSHAKGNK